MDTKGNHPNQHMMDHKDKSYLKLALMMALSFVVMYIAMYAMVNSFSNVFNNVNQFYMAGLMAAPMAVIMMALMGMMYPNKRLNRLIMVGGIVATLVFFLLIRQQAVVGDKQFLRSMIPHHAGAILMCQKAPITDEEIKSLCGEIISSQQKEIDQMKAILDRLEE